VSKAVKDTMSSIGSTVNVTKKGTITTNTQTITTTRIQRMDSKTSRVMARGEIVLAFHPTFRMEALAAILKIKLNKGMDFQHLKTLLQTTLAGELKTSISILDLLTNKINFKITILILIKNKKN